MKKHFAFICFGVLVGTPAWGLVNAGDITIIEKLYMCEPYPCARYNSSGGCIECDCGSVSCPSGQTVNDTCNCISSGGTAPTMCRFGQYWDNNLGCVACPTPGTSTGGDNFSGAINNPSLTDCYIPSTMTFNDDTGTWNYTSNCYYKN